MESQRRQVWAGVSQCCRRGVVMEALCTPDVGPHRRLIWSHIQTARRPRSSPPLPIQDSGGDAHTGKWSDDGHILERTIRIRCGIRARQLLDHHLRLPDEQGGFRAHGRDP